MTRGFPATQIGAFACAILAGLVALPSAPGQTMPGMPAEELRFEVISVKPDSPDYRLRQNEFGCTGGRFVLKGSSLGRGILWAWNIKNYQLTGMPQWARDSFFVIEAKSGGPVDEAQCKLMVRSLYRDRFKLVAHEDERDSPVYVLVIAPKGPKLRKVADADTEVNGPGFTIGGVPMQMLDPQLKGWSMEQLAFALGVANLGRPIFDRTGLQGIYKIALSFRQRTSEGDGPEITTAIEEQLGLRLEPRTETVKMLVIEHMSKPDPN